MTKDITLAFSGAVPIRRRPFTSASPACAYSSRSCS